MKRYCQRVISAALAATMLFGSLPAALAANETDDYTLTTEVAEVPETVEVPEAEIVTELAPEEVQEPAALSELPEETLSGVSGDLTWTLSPAGILTFSGSGAMKDYGAFEDTPWEAYNDKITALVLPTGLTRIGDRAFSRMNITGLTIPSTVQSIGVEAFQACRSLEGELVIPDSVKYIGEKAFLWCDKLTALKIGNGVETIDALAFDTCTELREVWIGSAVKTIALNAFQKCEKIERYVVSGSNPYFRSSADGVLFSKDGKKLVRFPDAYVGFEYVIPAHVETVCTYAFYNSVIPHLTIPTTVKTIESSAFAEMQATSVELLGCEVMESGAFLYCKLTDLHVGGNVVALGEKAFNRCDSLVSVTLDEGLKEIGDSAFYGCGSLGEITIPGSVKEVGDFAFDDCYLMRKVVLCEGVERVGTRSFYYNRHLTSITLPDSLIEIGKEAFAFSIITHINLPENLKTIGDDAFGGCWSLRSVIIPENVTYLGAYAFDELAADLNTVIFEGDVPDTVGEEPFPVDTTIYYRLSKADSGWSTPVWVTEEGDSYEAYPIIGDSEIDLDMLSYYGDMGQRCIYFIADRKTGAAQPVYGATMTVSGQSVQAGEGCDYITALVAAKNQSLLFTQEEMFPVELPGELLSSFNTVEFYPKTGADAVKTPFLQAIYGRHVKGDTGGRWNDLLHTGLSFASQSAEEQTELYVDVNWNGYAPGTIELVQVGVGGCAQEIENGYVDAENYSEKLLSGQSVYLRMRTQDGQIFSEKLAVVVTPPRLDVDFASVLPDADDLVPEDALKVLSQFEMKIDLIDFLSFKVEMEEDGTVKGLVGFKLLTGKAGEYYDLVKEMIQNQQTNGTGVAKLDDLLRRKGAILDAPQTEKLTISVKSQILGYLEGKYTPQADGSYEIMWTEGGVIYKTAGEAAYTIQQYMPNGVPYYLKPALSPSAQFTLPVIYQNNKLQPQPVELKFGIPVKLSVGLGWESILSGGVYGESGFTFAGKASSPDMSGYYEGKVGLEGAVLAFESDIELINSGKYYFMGPESKRSGARMVEQPQFLSAADTEEALREAEWEQQSRNYLDAPGLDAVSLMALDAEDTVMQAGAVKNDALYSYSQVQTMALNHGDQLAVWLEDAPDRADANRTVLYYSVYDAEDEKWSTPEPVDPEDDGTADFDPVLTKSDGRIYLVWKNAARALTNSDTLEDVTEQIDLRFAEWAGSSFYNFKSFGTEYYDTSAVAAFNGSYPVVTWVSNTENSTFAGDAPSYSIHRREIRNAAETELVADELYHIDGLASDGSSIWFTADTDGDAATVSDRELFRVAGGMLLQLTDNEVPDTKPTIVDGTLMWYSDGVLCSDGKQVGMAADTDRYSYVVGENMEAVLYVEDDAVRKSTLYASFNDGTGWGDPIALTGITGNIGSFSADLLTDGTLSVVACERVLDEESANYLADFAYLRHYTVKTSGDLAITGVEYIAQTMNPNGNLAVAVNLENRGMTQAKLVRLNAAYGGEEVYSELMYADLASGGSTTLYFNLPLPEDLGTIDEITVTAELFEQRDVNTADNTAAFALRLADLSVEEAMVKSNAQSTTVTVLVANRGQQALNDVTVQLLDGETVLAESDVEMLEVHGSQFVMLKTAQPVADETILTLRAAAAGLDAAQENISSNNSRTVLADGAGAAAFGASASAALTKAGAEVYAEIHNGTAETVMFKLCTAVYDQKGRMLDAAVEDCEAAPGTDPLVTKVLKNASDACAVRVFLLDSGLAPMAEEIVIPLK